MPTINKLASVLALLKDGRLEDADRWTEIWRQNDPKNSDLIYAGGLIQLVKGEFETAIKHLQHTVDIKPDNALYQCNLGVAYLKAEQYSNSIFHLETALTLQKDYSEAQYNLACAYLENTEAQKASTLFKILQERFPDMAEYGCSYADALRAEGKWKQAIFQYRKVLKIAPDFSRAQGNLGTLLPYFGENESALEHCERAVELAPESALAHLNLGRCLLQSEELDEAMEAFADAYELEPESAVIPTEIGWGWLAISETAEAANWFQQALMLDEHNEKAHAGLAQVMLESGNAPGALELLKSLAENESCAPDTLRIYANALWDDGDAHAALQKFDRLKILQPHNASIYAQSAQILASAGDVDAALVMCKKGLEFNPNSVPALHNMATSLRGKLEPEYLEQINKLLKRKKNRPGAKASLYNSLAYYYDGNREYKKAAEYMDLANKAQWEFKSKRNWNYVPEDYAAHCEQLKKYYTAVYFEKMADVDSESQEPVFIVGMPRSGTTLTEQILARHPKVLGLGERNFAGQSFQTFRSQMGKLVDVDNIDKGLIAKQAQAYLKHLAFLKERHGQSDAIRVIDKMPDNYSLLGWILTLFPNAKIIHCRRNLADVALSCWMTQFGKITWSNHWEHLETRVHEYLGLMEHWKTVLPGRFLEIDYEELVNNQEEQTRRLLEWIGVEWDPICLDFHESDRLVRTASITQVREPIYKRSVDRWRNYESYFHTLTSIDKEMKQIRKPL